MSTFSTPLDVCQIVLDAVDPQRPELAPILALARAGDPRGAAVALVHHLRGRETPRLGFTRAYVAALRAGASSAELAAARARWEKVLAGSLDVYHSNALASVGAETLLLAATPELVDRSAAKVLDYRAKWTHGYWGVNHSLCDLLSFLWPLQEASDEALVPIFAWLVTRWPVEWADARNWDEICLGSSGHNWWAHTFHGFFKLGLFFPELRGVAQFAALGRDYLQRESAILFEDDGWSKEGSPGYHGFAADNLIRFAHLMALNGMPVPEAVRARLAVIAGSSWQLLLPDGDYPVFGDHVRMTMYQGFHGQGRAENLPCNEARRRAARFGIAQAKFVAESLHPGAAAPVAGMLPDSGEDLWPLYRRLPSRAPESPDTALPRSGLYVMRQDWTPRADAAALIAGTLGPRISSHKQADLLSFELYARGRRVLVDNFYGSVAEERTDHNVRLWRISGAAHNLATVDGQDCVPVVREFLFGATVVPTVDDWRSDARYAYFSAVHEGYLRLPKPVDAVRRKLFYLRGGYWILIDRFTARAGDEHDYQLHFHLATPSRMLEAGRVMTLSDPGKSGGGAEGANLLIVPVPGAMGQATLGPNPYPIAGYENPDHLVYAQRATGIAQFITLLVPFAGAAPPKVRVEQLPVECDGRTLRNVDATALNIEIDGRRDFYFDQHLHWNLPWKSGEYQGVGRVYHSAAGM